MKTPRDHPSNLTPAQTLSAAREARVAAENVSARMSAGELTELHDLGVILISIALSETINRTRRLENAATNAEAMQ